MQAIWNIISSTASSELEFTGGGRTRALTIVRRHAVRGMRLTVDPRDATVRLTLGTRDSLRPALAWVAGKRTWVEGELARLPLAEPIVPDMVFALGNDKVRLDWNAEHPRLPRLVDVGERDTLNSAVHRLHVGGPRAQLSTRVLRFLRNYAASVIESETRSLAVANDLTIGKVGVGDPKSRWGSCTTSGDIRYSWRLVLAPAFVRRATVAHEVAHRVHMDHSRAFHRCAAELNGSDPTPARQWLRAHGPALHWFGRDG